MMECQTRQVLGQIMLQKSRAVAPRLPKPVADAFAQVQQASWHWGTLLDRASALQAEQHLQQLGGQHGGIAEAVCQHKGQRLLEGCVAQDASIQEA